MSPDSPVRPGRRDVRGAPPRREHARHDTVRHDPARHDPARREPAWRDRFADDDRNELWLALGAGALLGAAGAGWYALRKAEDERRRRPRDSAPTRTSRIEKNMSRPLVGRTVTIDKPRGEVYAFWRDFSNVPRFLEHVVAVDASGEDTHRWRIDVVGGREMSMDTRVLRDVQDEEVVWRSVEGSTIEVKGRVRFSDAPGGRGTEVMAVVRYRQPGGSAGALAAKLLQVDPETQIRRGLKRLKMLLETGEIATAANRVADARNL